MSEHVPIIFIYNKYEVRMDPKEPSQLVQSFCRFQIVWKYLEEVVGVSERWYLNTLVPC